MTRRFATFLFLFSLISGIHVGCGCGSCHSGIYYKVCTESCAMHGSAFGTKYDLPCADNVTFMTYHRATGMNVHDYLQQFDGYTEMPSYQDEESALAIHDPIYPPILTTGSSITSAVSFMLDKPKSVDSARLYVRVQQRSLAEIASVAVSNAAALSSGPQPQATTPAPEVLVAGWKAKGVSPLLFNKWPVLANGAVVTPATTVSDIHWPMQITGQAGMITHVTYRFEVIYLNREVEKLEVTFALQDFHQALGDYAAPIYAQGDMDKVMDILFIPARDNGPLALTADDFRKSCGAIIKQAVFEEPSLRFWRKQFNFWINQHEGIAYDAADAQPCHGSPSNMANLGVYELKALLHKNSQRDYTDPCEKLFSAELDLGYNTENKSAFIHELGHAAFGLCDEYRGGWNTIPTEHIQNLWLTPGAARDAAEFRHKTDADVKILTY